MTGSVELTGRTLPAHGAGRVLRAVRQPTGFIDRVQLLVHRLNATAPVSVMAEHASRSC
jgi:hypothetical protein